MTHKKVDRGERVVYMVFYYVAYKHTYFTLRERISSAYSASYIYVYAAVSLRGLV